MLDEILCVVKVVPVPKLVPPVAAAYQLIVPAEAVAPRATVPVPHLDPGVDPVIAGMVLTVNIAWFDSLVATYGFELTLLLLDKRVFLKM